MTAKPRRKARPRRPIGRAIALGLCVVFAIVGVLPLAVFVLVRLPSVRAWAARETAAALERELGLRASYGVRLRAWPPVVALHDVRVESTDGGPPALAISRIVVRPRTFALLAGRIDAGDVEILEPRVRLVVEAGEIKNLALRPPPASSGGGPRAGAAAPFSSVAITDLWIDAVVDGSRFEAREIDADVTAEEGGAFEAALRAGGAAIARVRPVPGRPDEDAVDEDAICRLDARARIEPNGSVLVRRLELEAVADFDPDAGTAPPCRLPPNDWRLAEVRLGGVRVAPIGDGPPSITGRIEARIPAPLAHRLAELPHVTGSIRLDAEVAWDGRARLPRVTGRIRADQPGMDGKVFSRRMEAEVHVDDERVEVTNLDAEWADGRVVVERATIEPFAEGIPMMAGPIEVHALELDGLLRDLGVHPQAHVGMLIREGHFDRFGGSIVPLALEGPLVAHVRGLEIADRPARDPRRRRLLGVKEGVVRTSFQVRPAAVVFSNATVETPRSRVRTTVALGYRSFIDLDVYEGTSIELADIAPVAGIPMTGRVTARAHMEGDFDRPRLVGEAAIDDFVFGGFHVGRLEPSTVRFEPLVLELANARVVHGKSRVMAPRVRIDFDAGADVLVDADVDTREAPHLGVRDFLETFHLDDDPRFADLEGIAAGTARVRYALGGREDACGGGRLEVSARSRFTDIALFGERYDEGEARVDITWDDQRAGAAGMRVDAHALSLRKGTGTVLFGGTIRHGGEIRGTAIATGIPLARLDALGGAGKMLDGDVALVATLGGTLGALRGAADVQVSRVRIGPASLPPSRLSVAIEPAADAPAPTARTRCGNPVAPPLDLAALESDTPDGAFRIDGELWGGQVVLDGLSLTRQKHRILTGKVHLRELDLGTLANLVPGIAFADATPHGALSATIDVARLPLDDPRRGEVTLSLDGLSLEQKGRRVRLAAPSGPIRLADDRITIPDLCIEAAAASGVSATLAVGGEIRHVLGDPRLDLRVDLAPVDLARLAAEVPGLVRVGGTASATLRATGPLLAPSFDGAATLRGGELAVRGVPVSLDEVDVDVQVGDGEVRVTRAFARVGTGTLTAKGRMPLTGLEPGAAALTLVARGVKLPVADGVDVTADADLEATLEPRGDRDGDEGEPARALPLVRGTVSLTSFSYTRPIAMSVDLGKLTGRKTEVPEAYDSDDDYVRFDVSLVSPKPLRFSNNLVDMQLEVAGSGLALSGTNQRFGAQGMLRILPESKLKLRANEFDVREGWVRFDDPHRIAPKIDVKATTEYRRYASQSASADPGGPAEGGAADGASGGAAPTRTSGEWRITMHAHGDADKLEVDFASDPPLGQEDILLLLTFGMTRAELDRGLASSLGETVGLEALSALTGADRAVRTIVPLIDEFRFGTAYSSKTGRTEPTVTVGKRITDRVRANVTTGLTEDREVRSSIEWKLGGRVSVQGSYDNVNDVSSSVLGNVGADLRWRLEFE